MYVPVVLKIEKKNDHRTELINTWRDDGWLKEGGKEGGGGAAEWMKKSGEHINKIQTFIRKKSNK